MVDWTREQEHVLCMFFQGRLFIIIDKMKVLKEVKQSAKSLITKGQAGVKTRSDNICALSHKVTLPRFPAMGSCCLSPHVKSFRSKRQFYRHKVENCWPSPTESQSQIQVDLTGWYSILEVNAMNKEKSDSELILLTVRTCILKVGMLESPSGLVVGSKKEYSR